MYAVKMVPPGAVGQTNQDSPAGIGRANRIDRRTKPQSESIIIEHKFLHRSMDAVKRVPPGAVG